MTQTTYLVTGASGHLGRRVVELLLEKQCGHIIAATRTPAKLADFAARGVEVRQADFEDPAALVKAFSGVDRLLLVSTDALDGTDRRLVQHRNAINAAEKAGVKHVLYTSFNRAEAGNPAAVTPDHFNTEAALAASSLDWTILRNSVYTEGLLQSLPQAVARGQLLSATGASPVNYVTREDCARAAAAALVADTTGRTTLEITGPSTVTYDQLAQIVSEISGKPVQHVAVDAATMRNILTQAGLPLAIAHLIVSFDEAIAQGYMSVATDVVERLTGKAPQSVREFLVQNKGVLVGQ